MIWVALKIAQSDVKQQGGQRGSSKGKATKARTRLGSTPLIAYSLETTAAEETDQREGDSGGNLSKARTRLGRTPSIVPFSAGRWSTMSFADIEIELYELVRYDKGFWSKEMERG